MNENYIEQISPNPISPNQQLNVNYTVNNGTFGQLILSNITNTINNVYSINTSNKNTTIAIGNLTPGIYTMILLINGIITDTKTLTIQ